jgi:hypothetical protein
MRSTIMTKSIRSETTKKKRAIPPSTLRGSNGRGMRDKMDGIDRNRGDHSHDYEQDEGFPICLLQNCFGSSRRIRDVPAPKRGVPDSGLHPVQPSAEESDACADMQNRGIDETIRNTMRTARRTVFRVSRMHE